MRVWQRNPIEKVKRSARSKVRRALLRGEITVGKCERCDEKKTHAHHDDYGKPLDIRWLCPTHHQQLHKEMCI